MTTMTLEVVSSPNASDASFETWRQNSCFVLDKLLAKIPDNLDKLTQKFVIESGESHQVQSVSYSVLWSAQMTGSLRATKRVVGHDETTQKVFLGLMDGTTVKKLTTRQFVQNVAPNRHESDFEQLMAQTVNAVWSLVKD